MNVTLLYCAAALIVLTALIHSVVGERRILSMYVRCVVGPGRLLYAMDDPYQFVPEEVAVQDNLPLDPGDKRKFFQTDAERLFSL